MKCDRKFPECTRCTSSRRSCEGYGVWGGGTPKESGKKLLERARIFVQPSRPRKLSFVNLSSGEWETFEWFERRTIPKLPAAFQSRYWTTLLSQASVSEPAVLHAILAVGSVHRASVISEGRTNILSASSSSRLTKDGLHHYVEALGQLRTHTVVRDIGTLRVILTSCIAFASLELLRGHNESARGHISHGMRLMQENGWLSQANEPSSIVTKIPNSTEAWITDAIKRLYLQMILYETLFLNKVHDDLGWPERHIIPPVIRLYTMAWSTLERLMLQSIWVHNVTKICKSRGVRTECHFSLVEKQATLKADLDQWYRAYKAGEKLMSKGGDEQRSKDFTEIEINYSLALLLCETALASEEEMGSHAITKLFAEPLRLVSRLWHELMLLEGITRLWEPIGFCHSILDVGALHAMFFVAVHCREPQLKLRAIAFLKLLRHRESFWDGHIVSAVASRIVGSEVGITSEALSKARCDDPLPQDKDMITTGECIQRLEDVTVVAHGEPAETVEVCHTVKGPDRVEVMKLGEYHVPSRKWTE